eukprot:3315523-Prymnesium_polylepis.3
MSTPLDASENETLTRPRLSDLELRSKTTRFSIPKSTPQDLGRESVEVSSVPQFDPPLRALRSENICGRTAPARRRQFRRTTPHTFTRGVCGLAEAKLHLTFPRPHAHSSSSSVPDMMRCCSAYAAREGMERVAPLLRQRCLGEMQMACASSNRHTRH